MRVFQGLRGGLGWLAVVVAVVGLAALPPHFLVGDQAVANGFYDVPAVLAIAACLRAARRGGGRSWLLFAAGIGCYLVADLTFFYVDSAFPGPADVGYLASYLFLGFAVATLVSRGRAGMAAAVADAALLTAAVTLFVYLFWMEPLASAAGESRAAQLVSCAYPVGDLLLIGIVLTAVLNGGLRRQGLLLAAMTLFLVSDLVYYGEIAHNSYGGSSAIDAGWMLAYLLVALAALNRSTPAGAEGNGRTFIWQRLLLPGACVFAVPAAGALELAMRGSVEAGDLSVFGAVIGLLVCLRLALIARERHRAELHFQVLIETTNDIVAIVDRDGVFRYVSPSVERVLGRPPTWFVGRHAFELVHPDDRDQVVAGIARVVAGTATETLFRARSLDESYRHLVAFGRLLERGPHAGQVLVDCHDITRRVEMEAELTGKDAQLRQAQKMEAIGLLAGGIAHDFNNLLTAISGYSELARNRTREERTAVDLDEIITAANRATSLTRQLLAYSRQQTLQPQPVELNEHLHGLEELLRRLIGEHIELCTHYADEPLWVEIDPGQLEQVVINLAVNARDAMPDGGTLLLSLTSTDGQTSLSVTDTGCGMDERTQRRIFDPFFTTKPVGEGTGLGLSTVYGILAQSDGTVTVESVPDAGSTFTVHLPLTTPPIRAEKTLHTPARASEAAGRILLVEDEAQVRAITAEMLTEANYQVLEAANGHEALDILERQPPIDLLLTDLVMPHLSGTQLATHVRTHHPNLPIIFCSGYAANTLSDQPLNDTTLLIKPYTSRELLEAVTEALNGQRYETAA